MKIVLIEGRQPFSDPAPLVAGLLEGLRAAGNEVDYVWLPTGQTSEERQDAEIAACLLYLEGTDRALTYGFPANFIMDMCGYVPEVIRLDGYSSLANLPEMIFVLSKPAPAKTWGGTTTYHCFKQELAAN